MANATYETEVRFGDAANYTKIDNTKITNIAGAGGTEEGQTWNDSTQKARAVYQGGLKQMLSSCPFTQTADKTISNTLIETSIFGTGVGTLTLPANFLVAGKSIRLTIWGYYSTATPAGTLQIKSYCDATNIHDGGAQTMTNAVTNQAFEIRTVFTCRTTGNFGTIYAQGKAIFYTTKLNSTDISLENTAVTTIDTTAACTLDIKLTWGTADASNTITSTNAHLEVLN